MAVTPNIVAPSGGEIWDGVQTIQWNISGGTTIRKNLIDRLDEYSDSNTQLVGASGITQVAQVFQLDKSVPFLDFSYRVKVPLALTEIELAFRNTISGGVPNPTSSIASYKESFSIQGFADETRTHRGGFGTTSPGLYAIVFEQIKNNFEVALVDEPTPNGAVYIYQNGNWVELPGKSIGGLRVRIDEPQSQQYQVQLSTDNGGSYKDIIALTGDDVMTINYDFSNEPSTDSAIIRVRSYLDGEYSPWAYSNPFTIGIAPPKTPDLIAPNGGEEIQGPFTIKWGSEPVEVIATAFDTTSGYSTSTLLTATTSNLLAQKFTALKTGNLQFTIDGGADNPNGGLSTFRFVLEIRTVDGSGNPTSTVLGQSSSVDIRGSWVGSSYTEFQRTITANVVEGQTYALVINPTSSSGRIYTKNDPNYPPAMRQSSSTWSNQSGSFGNFKIQQPKDESVDISNLAFQIQLSYDNGQNWKDLLALSEIGIEEYEYDFTNEPGTTTALIRIRAIKIEGNRQGFGPWETSDSVFTILKLKKGEFRAGGIILPLYEIMEGDTDPLRTVSKEGEIVCFKLVDINDSQASPFRIMTPSGIKAIAKELT